MPFPNAFKATTIPDLCERLEQRRYLLRLVKDRVAAAELREDIRVLESHLAAKLEAAQPVVSFAAYKRLRRACWRAKDLEFALARS